MNLCGRRIHIVGSADPETDNSKLVYTHSLVSNLTNALADEGANFLVPFREGTASSRTDQRQHRSFLIGRWLSLFTGRLAAGRAKPSGPNGRLIATLATSKTDDQIPAHAATDV